MTHRSSQTPASQAPARDVGRSRGMVLILVVVVIAVLSLAALTFSELMLLERRAARLSGRQAQARAAAESGVEMVRLFLAQDRQAQYDAGGWYDNPDRFRGVLVIDDEQARERVRFTLVAPGLEQGYFGGVRFGLEDESARVNLNALALADAYAENGGRQILMGLPGMTEDVADAILDWIDPDDEPREYGAEVDYYSALDPPYAPKNGPLETVEELLLVRDVTPWLLFGVDANRNAEADQSEPDPSDVSGIDNSDGSMTRGWAAYLTLYSLEANLNPSGEPKVYLNQDDMETLYQELAEVLDPQWATFIVAFRQYGPQQTEQQTDAQTGTTTGTQTGAESDNQAEKEVLSTYSVDLLDLSKKGEHTVATVLDLLGVDVEMKDEGSQTGEAGQGGQGGQAGQTGQKSTILETPFPDEPGTIATYLPTLMDYVTTTESKVLPARINVNQAPSAVLAGVPDMTSEILEQIISQRQTDPAAAESYQRQETWILCDGIVTLDEMKALMPFLTGGGSVYRTQVVGCFDQEGPATRIEVVLDATTSPARVIFWRDLTHLGRGYPLDTLGATPDQQ